LSTAVDIDDAEPSVPEGDQGIVMIALIFGPSVNQCGGHPLHDLVFSRAGGPCYAAHLKFTALNRVVAPKL
jgi:hypothetical protein